MHKVVSNRYEVGKKESVLRRCPPQITWEKGYVKDFKTILYFHACLTMRRTKSTFGKIDVLSKEILFYFKILKHF